jgi:hypothetical protein
MVDNGKNIARLSEKHILCVHEPARKKAVVLPNLFRIEPFIGLAQPIPLKPIQPMAKPGPRLKRPRR